MEQNSKLTFVVKVHDTQNSTWQGTITCLELNATQPFRSMLEMMRLMDSTIEEGKENESAMAQKKVSAL